MTLRFLDCFSDALEPFCAMPGEPGLTPALVRAQAPDVCMALERDGAIRARCSLWWRAAPPLPGHVTGCVGHYAAADLPSGEALLQAACRRLRAAGCSLALGPIDGNTWRRYRFVTDRGTDPPFFLEPDNPDDWPAHFEQAGFEPLAQYFSSRCEEIALLAGRRETAFGRPGGDLRLRSFDPRQPRDEIRRLWRVACDAFAGAFLYTPIGAAEFETMYAQLLPVARPELVLIAEDAGAPVGFCFCVPDVLQSRRGEPVDTVVVKTLAVARRLQGSGLGVRLFERAIATARSLGYRRVIIALMHEHNSSRKLGRPHVREFRRYTLFSRPP